MIFSQLSSPWRVSVLGCAFAGLVVSQDHYAITGLPPHIPFQYQKYILIWKRGTNGDKPDHRISATQTGYS